MNEIPINQIIVGDALDILKTLPENSVDSICCDPPAGINFMGKEWDGSKGGRIQWVAWLSDVMTEALRCLKPGGHAFVWALPKTSHWTACALEDAGFEIREKCYHIFSTGFPKSYNIAKGIEGILTRGSANWTDWKHLPGERQEGENVAYGMTRTNAETGNRPRTYVSTGAFELDPSTPEAQQWNGWGTALKPAVEEWILCRKPLAEPSVASNVLEWNTGGINIDGCRIGTAADMNPRDFDDSKRTAPKFSGILNSGKEGNYRASSGAVPDGRWPAHLLISHAEGCQSGACVSGCPALELDEQSGIQSASYRNNPRISYDSQNAMYGKYKDRLREEVGYKDEGGASRYFTQFYYAPKASKSERNLGCEGLPEQRVARMGHGNDEPDERTQSFISQPQANIHPTVKNQSLMKWLVRLITPPNGIVLDCFAGSGSTGVAAITEGFRFIGIEIDPEYTAIAKARLNHAISEAKAEAAKEKQLPLFDVPATPKPAKPTMLNLWQPNELAS